MKDQFVLLKWGGGGAGVSANSVAWKDFETRVPIQTSALPWASNSMTLTQETGVIIVPAIIGLLCAYRAVNRGEAPGAQWVFNEC